MLEKQKDILINCLFNLKSLKKDTFSEIEFSEVSFIKKSGLTKLWKIETGLYDETDCNWLIDELILYIGFKFDFPYSVPTIYIDKECLEKLGALPHISLSNFDVCIFDNFVIVDSNRPQDIILESIEKAKRTIIDGIKKNNLVDYDSEFNAYWIASEGDKEVRNVYYHLIESVPSDIYLPVLIYSKAGETYYIFYNKKENYINSYEEYLKTIGIKYKHSFVFYAGLANIKYPPYRYSNLESLDLIDDALHKEFIKFFNNKDSTKIVVFHKIINGNLILLGWKYSVISSKLKGFRQNSKPLFDLTFSKHLPFYKGSVNNFVIEDIKEQRILNRSNSQAIKFPKYKFLIAGLGSIGSNLIFYLNNLNFPEFQLVDNDYIEVENIGRFLLGYESLYRNKVNEIANFLKNKLPSQKVDIYNESFIKLYSTIPNIFNSQDYIFLCTGNLNLERYMINELYYKNLTKPIFIIWVEPFLLGGQCLYLNPANPIDVDSLFTDLYKYKFSVIEHSEFEKKRELFIQKEVGCQSSFSPYSSAHLSLFLSSIYTEIFKIIENEDTQSKAITWFGDFKLAKKLYISVNTEFSNYELKITIL